MNDLNTKSEVDLLSSDELGCEELDAVSGGECDIYTTLSAFNSQNPLFKVWVKNGCPVK